MKHVPISNCRGKAWHFDEPGVASNVYGRRVSEIAIQASIVKGLPLVVPCTVTAVPNGTYTPSMAAKVRAKREGTAKGYPDVIIDGIGPNAGKVCRAEIKAGTDLSPEQFERLNLLADNGHLCGVFRSLDTLIGFLVANGWHSNEAVPIGAAANMPLQFIAIQRVKGEWKEERF